MYKFFANKLEDGIFYFSDEIQKHFKVLRFNKENIIVNYENKFYECQFVFPNSAKLVKELDINNELDYKLCVAIPLIKQNHFEIALQKAVELGAYEIYVFQSQYVDKSNLNFASKKQRYEKIIFEACQQSFRNYIPRLHDPISFSELCVLDIKNKVLAYENKKNNELIKDCQDALIIVGPEGGFSQQEIDYAISCNVRIVSLTKTILRAETALIYMLSKLN